MHSLFGEKRRAAVDSMLKTYEVVRTLKEPRWVAITAPTGWGKTRLVQEVYRTLAMDQNEENAYWPADLLDGSRAQGELSARKRLTGSFDHKPRTVPDHLWWGIHCSDTRSVAGDLLDALSELTAHAPFLDRAWAARASVPDRSKSAVSGLKRELLREGGQEALSAGITAATAIEPLGLGLGWWLGTRLISSSIRSRRATSRVMGDAKIEFDAQPIVDETLVLLSRIARVGLPVIIAVEDAHLMDVATARLLERAMVLNVPLLVISTQTQVVRNSELALALRSREDRVAEIVSEGTPEGLIHRALEIPLLSEQDRVAIIREYFPALKHDLAQALAHRYANPLALRLFCTLPRYRSSAGKDTSLPSHDEIEAAPASVRDMYRMVWSQFDDIARECVHLGAYLSPYAIDPTLGSERAWDLELCAQIAQRIGLTDSESFKAAVRVLDGQWIRVGRNNHVTVFEADQFEIAAMDVDLLSRARHRAAREEMAKHASKMFAADSLLSPSLWTLALAAVALHATAYDVEPSSVTRAGVTVVRYLVENQFSVEQAEAVGRHLATSLPEGYLATVGRIAHAHALTSVGRPAEAGEVLEEVLSIPTLTERFSSSEVAILRADLAAAHIETGKYAIAAAMLREVISSRQEHRLEGRAFLTLRLHLAVCLGNLDRLDDAINEMTELLATQEFQESKDVVWKLQVKGTLAGLLGDADKFMEAVATRTEVVAGLTSALGADHPLTLLERSNLASQRCHLSAVERADGLKELEAILATRRLVSGATSPAVAGTHANLADALTLDGQHRRALGEHRKVVALSTVVLGARHPLVLSRRNNLALSLVDNRNLHAAAKLLSVLIPDMISVLGAESRKTLSTQASLADIRRLITEHNAQPTDAFGRTRPV